MLFVPAEFGCKRILVPRPSCGSRRVIAIPDAECFKSGVSAAFSHHWAGGTN